VRRFTVLGTIVAALVVVGVAGATQTGNGYRWPRASLDQPATAVIHPDATLSAAWLGFVKQAADTWNAGQTNLRVTVGSPATCSATYSGGGICVWAVNRPDVGWWGTWFGGGYVYNGITMLTTAYVELNDAKVNPADPAQAWNARYITCHELGEAIGLHDHSDTNDPLTSYDSTCLTNVRSKALDHPSQEDYTTLQAIYSTVFPPPTQTCKTKRCGR
jgi:hypothetical protein